MSRNHEWLELIEVSGPFLALPVLREAFPQGLEELDALRARRLRSAYEEWRDAVDSEDSDLGRLHEAWVEEVLRTALEADDELLRRGDRVPSAARADLPEHDTAIVPDWALVDPARSDALLVPVHVFSPDTDLVASMRFGGLSCSPADRMAMHLRAVGCPLGVVTNGERWMVVHAPVGQVSTFASWYARLWGQEPETLRAFASLLGVRRLFGPEQDRLPSLFERSLKHQDEVTDALGEHVRRAVEVLVQALDRADQDRNRELLRDVKPQELYEAGLTVMMRLVFLLAAEERGLLLLGEPRYDSFYAVSTLRMQLRVESEEILERRRSAWSRLLAVFRAVFGGIDHPTLHLPAMGGSLFDPDRFPFLEGRSKGSSWRHHPAAPLPIDDRTVLLLLDAIQTFEGRTLSYRALDVEQIGHVYEGLLERTVKRVDDVTLELESGAQAKDPRVTLGELESARLDGDDAVVALFVERTRRSESSIRNALEHEVDARLGARLLTACRGDVALRDRLEPYAWLLRTDPWGYPLVHPEGAFVVVMGIDRRETGTHYTPKSLTEKIVEETLTPLVYDGPAKGAPRESWTLKSPAELLDLKVCDPAMGSGAFLVQACRCLSARVVEAWGIAEAAGNAVNIEGRVHGAGADVEPIPATAEARAEQARRLVAERCLYGVDLNPLAVELAKLSLWLVTIAKGRPFGFLDHNLRCGDSLLGITCLEQLTELSMAPKQQTQGRLFGRNVRQAVEEALAIRLQLRQMPIRDIRDVEAMASLDAAAREKISVSEELADEFISTVLTAETDRVLESRLAGFAVSADRLVNGDNQRRSLATVSNHLRPLHWPLEFPEVFSMARQGFDAVLSNPPWGARLADELQRLWKTIDGDKLGRLVDSFHLFILRAGHLMVSGSSRYHTHNGFSGLVVPDVLLYQGYSQPLREHLLRHHRLVTVCDLGEGVFLKVVRPCCFVVFAACRDPSAEYELSIEKWATGHHETQSLSSAAVASFPGCVIPTTDVGEYREVAALVLKAECKLANLIDDLGIQRGASADNKDVFVVDESLARKERLEEEVLRPVVTGGVHVRPFEVAAGLPLLIYTDKSTKPESVPNIVKWVLRNAHKITCKEVKDGKHELHALHRARERRVFERTPKLLGVITADRPKVAVDKEQRYALDGVYVLAPRHDIDPYFLAGILNSDLMARVYRVFSQEEGRVMAQVKPTLLGRLPMVFPDQGLELSERIASLARRLHGRLSHEDRTALERELNASVEDLFVAATTRRGVEAPEVEPSESRNSKTNAAPAKKASKRRASR